MALVTCGGLCPGMNNVIRGIVLCAWHRYGVRNIIGLKVSSMTITLCLSSADIAQQLTPSMSEMCMLLLIHQHSHCMIGTQYGFQGLNPEISERIQLTPQVVKV